MNVPPLEFQIKTHWVHEIGEVNSWIEIRGTFRQFEAGGFLSGSKFTNKHSGGLFAINPMQRGVWVAETPPETLETFPFVSLEKLDTGDMLPIFENFRMVWCPIDDVGQWETVNSHQWTGRQPATVKRGGTIIETEPALLDVAAPFNTVRVTAYRGHNARDDVFSLTTLLNQYFGYWRDLIGRFHDEILDVNPNALHGGYMIEDDQDRERFYEVFNAMEEAYEDNRPRWDRG